jgi:hypothetical protein
LDGLAKEHIGLFYGQLVYFTANWSILLPFGMFYDYLVYFPRFGILPEEKSGNPGGHC